MKRSYVGVLALTGVLFSLFATAAPAQAAGGALRVGQKMTSTLLTNASSTTYNVTEVAGSYHYAWSKGTRTVSGRSYSYIVCLTDTRPSSMSPMVARTPTTKVAIYEISCKDPKVSNVAGTRWWIDEP